MLEALLHARLRVNNYHHRLWSHQGLPTTSGAMSNFALRKEGSKEGRKQGRMDVNLLPAWALHFSEIGSVKFEPNVPSFFDLGMVP